MNRKVLLPVLSGSIALMSAAAVAQGATIEHTDSVPVTTTNWSETLSFPQFDPALGTLLSVSFELSGDVEGDAKFESLDGTPATVTLDLAAQIELQRPDTSVLVAIVPLVQTSDDVTAFDGVIDFLGTSGRTYEDLNGNASDSGSTSAPADLALFTGLGTIDLPADATGASTGSGAGNLIVQFATAASADAKVIYEYDPPAEGACCAHDGSCSITTEADCVGDYQGDDTDCDPNPCPVPMGACCTSDGNCEVTAEADCDGVYQGNGTDCDPNPCPPTPVEERTWGEIKNVYR